MGGGAIVFYRCEGIFVNPFFLRHKGNSYHQKTRISTFGIVLIDSGCKCIFNAWKVRIPLSPGFIM